MDLLVAHIDRVAGCRPTSSEAGADWVMIVVMFMVIISIFVAMAMVLVEHGLGMGVERSGGGSEHGGFSGWVARAVVNMLEALLTARIGEAVARSRLVAIAFCILDKGHDSLLNLEHRPTSVQEFTSGRSRTGASWAHRPLHHLISSMIMSLGYIGSTIPLGFEKGCRLCRRYLFFTIRYKQACGLGGARPGPRS